MYCAKCGAKITEGTSFCPQCGAPLKSRTAIQDEAKGEAEGNSRQKNFAASEQTSQKTANLNPEFYGSQNRQNAGQENKHYKQPQPQPKSQPIAWGMGNQAFYNNYNIPIKNYDPSKDYTPIGMWGYFGYQILFAIPLIGFILILIFSFGGTRNINLRNYARSTFCFFIIVAVAVLLIALIIAASSAH